MDAAGLPPSSPRPPTLPRFNLRVRRIEAIQARPELQHALKRKADEVTKKMMRNAMADGTAAHHMATADRSIEYTARKPGHSDIWA